MLSLRRREVLLETALRAGVGNKHSLIGKVGLVEHSDGKPGDVKDAHRRSCQS